MKSAIKALLIWLRNGASIVGDDEVTIKYRETCLERAYVILSQDIVPHLEDVSEDESIMNLVDVSSMMQKKTIQS